MDTGGERKRGAYPNDRQRRGKSERAAIADDCPALLLDGSTVTWV
jgi:hypothetical protein